jgi:nucleotide-binding universal stress UspA family protein
MLFATDFSSASEAVLSHAVAIARRHRSKLYVAHVTPPDLRVGAGRDPEGGVEAPEDHALDEMSRLIALGGLRKLRHRTLLEEGDIAHTLLATGCSQAK